MNLLFRCAAINNRIWKTHEGARFLYVQRLSMARKSVISLLAMDRDFYRPETQSTAVTRGFLNGWSSICCLTRESKGEISLIIWALIFLIWRYVCESLPRISCLKRCTSFQSSLDLFKLIWIFMLFTHLHSLLEFIFSFGIPDL